MTGVAAAAVAAALALPAAAAAKVVTYGGNVASGGEIALDVVVKKKKPKKVVEIRAANVPAECEISGSLVIWTEMPRLGIKVKNGAFKKVFVDRDFGNRSKITGDFKRKGRKIGGEFTYSNHFPADEEFPEEDCNTGPLRYSVKKGGKDVIVPPPERPALRRG